jgi:hypothetical protein
LHIGNVLIRLAQLGGAAAPTARIVAKSSLNAPQIPVSIVVISG